jgi:predicted  nucleic acid-binding Zn-ribbon protein
MISPPRIPVLIRQYIPGKYATSLKYLQLHISLIVIGREEGRYDATLPYTKNTTNFERREGKTPLFP